MRIQCRGSGAAIFWIFAGPQKRPFAPGRRSEQRFRRGIQMQIGTEIHQQQPVIVMLSEKSHEKCFFRQDRAIYTMFALSAKHWLFPAEAQEIAMQCVDDRACVSRSACSNFERSKVAGSDGSANNSAISGVAQRKGIEPGIHVDPCAP